MEVAANAPKDALQYAWEIQAAASEEGFDWPNINGVLDKIAEEGGEIREALDAGDVEHAKKELGDLLLAAVNAARFLHANPAQELLAATERFRRRFGTLSSLLEEEGRVMKECTLTELDEVWNKVKKQERLLRENAS